MGKFGRLVLKIAAAVILVIGVLALILSAFSGEKRNGSAAQGEQEYLIRVGLAQSGEDTPWKAANTQSYLETFTEENGYALLCADAGTDPEKQFEDVEAFVRQNVDYIILNPVVETGWEEILEEAKEARIPVILINNKLDEADEGFYRCWLGSDVKKQSRNAGKWLYKYLKKQEREDEEIAVAAIQGSIGTPEQMARAEAYQEMLEKYGNWSMKAQQTGEDTRDGAKEVMRLFLEHHPDIDVVFAESDEMALGAADAITEAGRTCGGEDGVLLISFGGGKEALQAVADGALSVTFEKSPEQAPKAAELIQRMDAGISVDKEQYVKETYYDAEKATEEVIEKRKY